MRGFFGLIEAKRIVDEGGRISVTGYSEDQLEQARNMLPANSLVLRNDAPRPLAGDELAESIKPSDRLTGYGLMPGFSAPI